MLHRDPLNDAERDWLIFALGLLVGFLLHFAVSAAGARDLGQWQQIDPTISRWFRTLMQPDNPSVPCCGEADAYWADSYDIEKDASGAPTGNYIAIVTDEREDAPLQREHIPPGTRFVVPSGKVKVDQSNPTGHGVLFVRRYAQGEAVYCYCPPGGV